MRDIGNAEVAGVIDVADKRLPGIPGIRLPRPGLFRVHLSDRKPMPARHRDMVGVAVSSYPGKA